MNKLKDNVRDFFKGWSKLDIIWLILANLSILGCSISWRDSKFSIIMALTGISANILVAKGKILNYPLGIINVLMYSYVAYNSALYGDFTLNLFYYFPMNVIGWYMWNKQKGNKDGQVEFKVLTLKQLAIVTLLTIIAWLGYGYILKLQNDLLPLTDSASTVLSVISMILMVKCYREQWIGWILVNVVSIAMWYVAYKQGGGDLTTLLMWVVYLVNSVYGLAVWFKSKEE